MLTFLAIIYTLGFVFWIVQTLFYVWLSVKLGDGFTVNYGRTLWNAVFWPIYAIKGFFES